MRNFYCASIIKNINSFSKDDPGNEIFFAGIRNERKEVPQMVKRNFKFMSSKMTSFFNHFAQSVINFNTYLLQSSYYFVKKIAE